LEIIMLNFITSALVAGSFALTTTQDASACGGGRCGGRRTCAPAPACDAQPAAPAAPSATPDMPGMDMPPAPPATAQNGRSQYRSYSYEPSPASQSPAMRSYSRQNSSHYNQFRADRKMRGL
jgi:hypothetical protein